MRLLDLGSIAFLCSACTLPSALDTVRDEAPPPELGRPVWVRAPAGVGAWIGGAVGAVVSIGVLPLSYPISLVAAEPLGYSKQEFLFGPVTMGASSGHFLFGAPFDLVDFTFRRAWVETPTPYDYDFVPMQPPVGAGPSEARATEPAEAPAAEKPEQPAAEKPPVGEAPPPSASEKPPVK